MYWWIVSCSNPVASWNEFVQAESCFRAEMIVCDKFEYTYVCADVFGYSSKEEAEKAVEERVI